jgi:hypothetical protein
MKNQVSVTSQGILQAGVKQDGCSRALDAKQLMALADLATIINDPERKKTGHPCVDPVH